MPQTILVPLKRIDQFDEVAPYLKKIATAGRKIIFLVPVVPDGFGFVSTQLTINQTEIHTIAATARIRERYSSTMQKAAIVRKLHPVCSELKQRGVEVTIDAYTSSLRNVMRTYLPTDDVSLVLMSPGIENWWGRLLRTVGYLGGLFRRSTMAPVLVLRPGRKI